MTETVSLVFFLSSPPPPPLFFLLFFILLSFLGGGSGGGVLLFFLLSHHVSVNFQGQGNSPPLVTAGANTPTPSHAQGPFYIMALLPGAHTMRRCLIISAQQ